jgi:hypothetical protein
LTIGDDASSGTVREPKIDLEPLVTALEHCTDLRNFSVGGKKLLARAIAVGENNQKLPFMCHASVLKSPIRL